MGTWDHGLLDNDCASDGVADIAVEISADIAELGAARPTLASTSKLGGAVGTLLQLSPYSFTGEPGRAVVAALQAHVASIRGFPPPFRRILSAVIAGEGEALAGRPARMPRAHIALLHVGATQAPFGKREPALFAGKSAMAYVQSVARRCVEGVDDDFADASNWSDLCREGVGLGGLAALLVLSPCRVPARKIAGWRRKARQGLAALAAEPDDELAFHRLYYANLDRTFAALARRFAE